MYLLVTVSALRINDDKGACFFFVTGLRGFFGRLMLLPKGAFDLTSVPLYQSLALTLRSNSHPRAHQPESTRHRAKMRRLLLEACMLLGDDTRAPLPLSMLLHKALSMRCLFRPYSSDLPLVSIHHQDGEKQVGQ